MASKSRRKTQKRIHGARRSLFGLKNTAMAAAATAALTVGNLASSLRGKAADAGSAAVHKMQRTGEALIPNDKKTGEVITMKKSTLFAILAALAAVAGVLAALYLYVLRREKELDEYEQLLFSEEFNDDLPYDDMDEDSTDEI